MPPALHRDARGHNRPMLIHPQIDPIAVQIGPLAVHWYGLTYLAAFGLFVLLGRLRLQHPPYAAMPPDRAWTAGDVEDFLFWGVLGVVLGGRIGYCLFYQPAYYAHNPLEILAVWKGGMAFHGGLLGVILAMAGFALARGRSFWEVADFVAPCVPTGLACGRLGNFINGELWGRVAPIDLPWGMIFPGAGDLPRHPSQIYQLLMEGLLLFVLLWWYASTGPLRARVSAAFLVGYGVLRFAVEFFREPDAHLGLLGLGLSMGQWLCIPMVLAGVILWLWAGRSQQAAL